MSLRRTKKEKESKSDSLLAVIIRWFTEAKQYLAAFAASIAAFGVLKHQISRIEWTNWVVDIIPRQGAARSHVLIWSVFCGLDFSIPDCGREIVHKLPLRVLTTSTRYSVNGIPAGCG